MKLKTLCTLFCLIPSLGMAKSGWYEIELIIFAHQSNRYVSTEIWPQEPGGPLRDNSLYLVDLATYQSMGGNNQSMLIMLSQNQLKLRHISAKLAQSRGNYLPLFHAAWRQLVHDRNKARPIYIRSHQSLPRPVINQTSPNQFGPVTSTPARQGGIPILEGTLKLSLSRYLHANFDLLYSMRNPDYRGESISSLPVSTAAGTISSEENESGEQAQAEPPPPMYLKFRMLQHRRMRTKKLHFIDHPKLGIFIKILPYKVASGPGSSAPQGADSDGPKATPLRR